MKRFAFIFHPHDINFFAEGFSDNGIKRKRPFLVRDVMKWMPPFKRSVVTGIKSRHNGEAIMGDMILLNLLPEHMSDISSEITLSKLMEAGKLAEKLGDRIVGLGAYAAIIGNRGITLSENINIAVTTGNTYTVAVIPEVIEKVLEEVNKKLSDSNILILGATNTIGRICCKRLLNKCASLNLVAQDYEKLKKVYSEKDFYTFINKDDEELLRKSVLDADLILVASGSLSKMIDINTVKTGAVIYDTTNPKSIKRDVDNTRKDVLIIDGDAISPPGNPDFHFSFGFPPGLAYACMAETMILTLEGRFENYSIGKALDFSKMEEIKTLANKHGFQVERFTRGGKVIDSRRIREIKELNSKKRVSRFSFYQNGVR